MIEEDKDKSPHMNMDETDEEAQDTGPAFDDDLDSEVNNFIIEDVRATLTVRGNSFSLKTSQGKSKVNI
jgi:hypothetical protein